MLTLSQQALLESNKLESDGCWLILLEIGLSSLEEPLRLVRNTEDITWGGKTWTCFPFDLGEVGENSKGEMPTVTVKVSNVTKAVQPYVEASGGGIGAEVVLRVVNSKYLSGDAEIEEYFTVQSTTCGSEWIEFELGGDAILNSRFPQRRILKDRCPFKYKSVECGCTSSFKECNHTLANCTERNNNERFGGEPSIPQGGLYTS